VRPDDQLIGAQVDADTSDADEDAYQVTDSARTTPSAIKATGLLTVWRRLHVELDSMEAVPTTGAERNSVSGTITQVTGAGPWTATTDQSLLDADMYEKGTLVKGGNNYTVKTGAGANTSGANSTVTVTNANPGEGAFTSLTDDDTKTMPHLPDTGKMNSIFDDCYITVVNDAEGGSEDVSFDLNAGQAQTTNGDIDNAIARGSAGDEANDWWVVYVLGGYQAGHDQDNDPDSESGVGGNTHGVSWQASIIYLETIRDRAVEHAQNATTLEQQIVVHEVGHQVLENGNHTNNTIMQQSLPVAAEYETFSDADIATIRAKTSSPGVP